MGTYRINFNGGLSRMQLRMNQTLWASGLGKNSGSSGMLKPNWNTSGSRKKKKKKEKEKLLDWETSRMVNLEPEMADQIVDTNNEVSKDKVQSEHPDKAKEENTAAEIRKEYTGNVNHSEHAQQRISDLQKAIVWAEILGEPVSTKRRKKRMNQLYGNQGNAYRR